MKKQVLLPVLTASMIIAGCATQTNNDMAKATKSTNKLLTESTNRHGIESFEDLTTNDYRQATLEGIRQHKAEIDAIANNKKTPTFENTIAPFDQSGKLLERAEMTFGPLDDSNSTDSTRALSKELSPILSAHSDDIYMNQQLFERVKKVYDEMSEADLTHEQQKVVEKIYKRFERNGANLSDEDKEKLRKLNLEISALQIEFSQNLLHETNNTYVVANSIEELKGLPQANIERAALMATENGQPGKWMFNMQRASCNPVLQYCSNRELRHKIYDAYYNRGNQDNEYNSKDICAKLVALRLERAKLMGFESCAAQILDTRMAKTPEAVYNLLDQIWTPAVKKANEELADIREEMKKDGLSCEPEGWDYMYYSDRARKAKYNFDESEVSEYLEINNVLQGIFYVANKLYGVTFKEVTEDVPSYEPTAKAWEVYDKDQTLLAIFYSDYYPRDGKRAGAWCTSFRSQRYEGEKRIEPIVVNVCSMTPPSSETPALQSIDNVETMFHEFGHALHSFMRDVHYNSVGGVERDFVELPSQINEHWAFEPEVLAIYAKHYKTGKIIPDALVKKIEESGKYGQGFATVEYLAASYSDMDLHVLKEVPADLDVMAFEQKKLAERGIPRQIMPRYRITNFSHTMGGGYTAGYYSYIWAEVLDADGFEAFKETGDIFNQEVAERFRKYILTPGGIDDGMTMYKNFRGSEPKIDALLRNRGLK
ncbi:MAG: M3 family metallopeptidase [Bacteroidaceae bacterium]|nr:M3 family metallopeptidase [Bacteroidaceae bacterium]